MPSEYWRKSNEKISKVFTLLFALLSLTIMTCTVSFAAEPQVYVTKDGYTLNIKEADEPSFFADSDQKATKNYDLEILDRNGTRIGVYRITFTGMYSRVDNASEMTNVSVRKISGSTSWVTWQTRTEYEDGFATFYLLGEYMGTVSGHIASNGTITVDYSE